MAEYIKKEDVKKSLHCKGNDILFCQGKLYIPFRIARNAIENTPAADVVKVRHGKWESFEIPHMVRCSECGVSDLDIHRTKFVFCPYCGARMDGTPKERGGEK